MKHRRIVVTERGGPDVLRIIEEAVPEPQPGEIRVKTLAAGVSAYDVMLRSKRFPGFPKPPYTPGEDLVGTVDAVGSGVDGVVVGQRVGGWTFGDGGAYAEYVCRPAAQMVPVPDGVDSADAVAVVVNFLTADIALHHTAAVESGERVLVHGAAGGVGSALVQLGALAGVEVFGTASDYNHELVLRLGATPIDYRTENFVERIRDLTGDGVDVVIDPVGGGRHLLASHRALRRGGRLVFLGVASTARNGVKVIPFSLLALGLLKVLSRRKRVPGSPSMSDYPQDHNDWYRRRLGEFFDLLASGKIDALVTARVPLFEPARAHELMERGGHAGKIVLTA